MRRGITLGFVFLGYVSICEAAGLRTFKDWVVGCDNGVSCRAVGMVAEQDQGERRAYVVIDREGGPGGRLSLRLVADEALFGVHPPDGGVVTLVIDDKPAMDVSVEAAFAKWLEGADGLEKLEIVDEKLAWRVLEAMKTGRAMRPAGKDAKPDEMPNVSLQGLMAALLFMDEVQGRVGTVTALSRKGEADAGKVPAAPPLPRLVAVPLRSTKAVPDFPKALRARALRENEDCAETDGETWQERIGVTRLNDSQVLYMVPCWLAAYQAGVAPYLESQGKTPVPLTFDSVDPETGKVMATQKTLTDPSGLEASSMIQALSKGRGLGDCGTAWGWTWTGRSFHLAYEIAMPECRGVADGEDWISLWRTKED